MSLADLLSEHILQEADENLREELIRRHFAARITELNASVRWGKSLVLLIDIFVHQFSCKKQKEKLCIIMQRYYFISYFSIILEILIPVSSSAKTVLTFK